MATPYNNDGPWIYDEKFDDRTQTFISIRKKTVDVNKYLNAKAGDVTLTAYAPGVYGAGKLREYQGRDTNSIWMIESTFPDDILDKTIQYYLTAKYSFPDYIPSVEFIGAAAEVSNQWSFDYGLDVDIKNGPSGAFKARLTETFVTDPNVTLPAIFAYKLTSGTISVAFVYGLLALQNLSPLYNSHARTFSIPSSLHPALNPAPPFVGNAVDIDYSGVDASVPTSPNSGDYIVIDVQVEPHIAGLWVRQVLEVLVPTYAP